MFGFISKNTKSGSAVKGFAAVSKEKTQKETPKEVSGAEIAAKMGCLPG